MSHAHPHHPSHRYTEKQVERIPQATLDALHTAMAMEGAPDDWFADLAWIMAQESEGIPGRLNPSSKAAGLFQIAVVNHDLFPNGKASIGNATDECRAGIRYIRQRYHTAAAAKAFWQQHHWY